MANVTAHEVTRRRVEARGAPWQAMEPRTEHPTHAEIALRAHALWEAAGRPAGADQEHWYQAERELATSPFASRTPPR